ncbi:MAG: spore photoproduct lyase family protein [Thermodesulfobacteriota bacterium]
MHDPSTHIRHIFVEECCSELADTRAILARAAGIPVTLLPDRQPPPVGIDDFPQNLTEGKRNLYLCRNRGRFLKTCPATRHYRCCGYHVLNIGAGCPMDCVYCILQAYLNNPCLSFFVNSEDLFAELDSVPRDRFLRIGTGEFTDSMALDRLTGLSARLVEFFADRDNMVLELKSKAVVVDHLRHLRHRGRTIMAWSLNSPRVVAREEIRTAPLAARLDAAARCAEWGYPLAFHFDPIVYHEGWQEEYETTIEALFARVPAERIAWISLGGLRYLPQLSVIAGGRFPGSAIFHEEFVPGLDGKQRYFRRRRAELYRHIGALLRRHAHPHTCIYFCMESDEIWRETFGYTPEERDGLPAMLDRTARMFRA